MAAVQLSTVQRSFAGKWKDPIRRRWRVADRIAAALMAAGATTCAILHVYILIEEGGGVALAMLFLAILCLGCAWHGLFTRASVGMWVWMIVGSVLMIALHLLGHGVSGHSHFVGDTGPVPGATQEGDFLRVAMGVTVVEFAIAFVVLAVYGVVARRGGPLAVSSVLPRPGEGLSEAVRVFE